MTRSLGTLIALLLVSVALSAPAPKRFGTGWHRLLDPDKNCRFIQAKDFLTIEIPGSDHDYDPHRDQLNAPRLLREIEGDFEMQVRVRIDCRPSTKSTVKGIPSCVAAGFLLIPAAGYHTTCIRFGYGVAREGRGSEGYAGLKWQSSGGGRSDGIWDKIWPDWPFEAASGSAYLRLQRQDETFYPYVSPDGKKWALLVGGAGFRNLPAKLKVGLAAYSTSSDRAKVRFDQFKLLQNPKKKR